MSDSLHNTIEWQDRLDALVPLFGHRNWIVVADAAYPAQSRAGIETIAAAAYQIDVLRTVLHAIESSSHVRANIYLDHELEFVAEQMAAGVTHYRDELPVLLRSANITRLLHEEIIDKLDQAAQMFRVLIIKTQLTIPYTSVFFELDCGYWDADAERRLRSTIAAAEPRPAP